MRLWVLAFFSGILFLQIFSHLPNTNWVICIFLSAIILELFFVKYYKPLRLIAGFIFGFVWCFIFASYLLVAGVPSDLEGKNILITGYINSIPDISENRTAFLFSPQSGRGLIHLSWQHPTLPLRPGDKWQFQVRLKNIHGMMNPGGFDYEGWAFQEGIRSSGYIVNSQSNQLKQSHWYHFPIQRFRLHLKQKMESVLPPTQTSPWIIALALGERQGISQENWAVLRNTGTNHLMAIAGLHIGFMAGFAFAIVNALWRRIPRLSLKFPAQHAGSIAALLMALMYSALAGFSIPTERACLMLTIFMTLHLCRRKILAWQAWCTALLCVLLWNPLSVLTESFWLSFGSVAFIIYGISGRLAPTGLWWKWGRIQWVIALGLIPLGIGLFQQCSFVAMIANSIAIPVVGFIIVPMTLLGCVCLFINMHLGAIVLTFADKVMGLLWHILSYLANVSWASWYHYVPYHWMVVVACLGMVVLLVPNGFPGRWLGVIGLLPLLLYQPMPLSLGDAEFTLLDVGQGLSAVVYTKNHVLVFDAGPKFGDNFDMGESVVVPFLRTLAVKKVDMLVISHGDNDHIGGANAIINNLRVLSVKTSVPDKMLPTPASLCLQGDSWRWDEVDFKFLYPTQDQLDLNNDSSCVLKITSHGKSVLLTGDIEKNAERFLLGSTPNDLSSDILVAPHHGSKTSAVSEFINQVNPHYVLFATGYRNRYHFPNSTVVTAYQNKGAILINSAETGAVQFNLNERPAVARLFRLDNLRYWYFHNTYS